MKFLASLALALSATAGAFAQNNGTNATTFADGLLSALRANNLSMLADAVGNNSQSLLGALMGGNKTVLAPSNEAFMALGNVDNQTLIATLAYHVLNGSYTTNSSITTGNKTIAASALNMTEYVMLPHNRSQVVVMSKYSNNNTAYVQLASGNVSFAMASDGPEYQNIRVQPIEQVLMIPGNTSTIVSELGESSLVNLLQSNNLVMPLDDSIVTVFAPTNDAISMVQSTVQAATPQEQTAVLLNHVLNGTVVYSTSLANTPSAISASGNELKFMTNSSGAYVSSGNITAKIIMSDYVAKNGVVHVIDRVLVNTTENTAAASSAYSSNTAAAATQTSAPGVGSNGGSGSGSGSGSSGKGNSAATLQISGGAAAVAALLGSGFWLLA